MRLHFIEQAHVLDRDHRLIGKGLKQRDLLVGELPGSGRPTTIAPIGASVTNQRNGQHAAEPAGDCSVLDCILGVREHVRDRDDAARQDRSGRLPSPRPGGRREIASVTRASSSVSDSNVRVSGQMQQLAVEA